ncbi:MAG: hypothetical protein NC087_06905 [Anaeroplasma bactoclasticum]|nr:hypothetical protein [Anaeroplasma bactoclasticum]MCM1557249.1 hypothetical protein [Anaeroplasma bactoclasticum]
MRLDILQEVYIWVKKTTFNKTEACLFIYHCLLCERQVSKKYLEEILNIKNRTTLYNYIEEIKNYISDFDSQIDYIIDINYDADSKEYILELRKKK